MKLLSEWTLKQNGEDHKIELYWGDLSCIPAEQAVDLLVVSAFRNDYIPTPGSLIGALHRNGISVNKMSFDKDMDMRDEFSCWLSRPVGAQGFRRLLCVESGWRGTPPEIADDLFRAIAPISVTNVPTRSVALPLIGAGDQGYAPSQMLEAVLKAAVSWLGRGMPIQILKIVAYSDEAASLAKKRFIELKAADLDRQKDAQEWDVFLSYSHSDYAMIEQIHRTLSSIRSSIRVFCDRKELKPGTSWLMKIAEALDASHRVLALYTPSYWDSVPCKDELTAAYVRQSKERRKILFPVFYQDTKIPSFFEGLQYADCREANMSKVTGACQEICEGLP